MNGDKFVEQIQDVQKQVAEEAIRLLLSAVQQSRDSIIITTALLNPPGPEIVYVNPAFSLMTGYSTEEVLGKTPRILQGRHTDRQQLNDLRYHLETGKPYHGEAINYHKDGTEFYVEWNITPIRNAEEEITHYVAIQRDITDRKQLEQEREQLLQQEHRARTQAEAANRSKDEFLTMLSHELKTPLTPILGWAKVLRTKQLPEAKLHEVLETIEEHARRQAQLVDDLLDLSHIVQGKLTLNLSAVDLVEPIAAALNTVRLSAEAKGIQIKTQLPPQVGQLMGDTGRLQQVFWNLLSNAIKFTPYGGRVEVRLERVEAGEMGRWGDREVGGWGDGEQGSKQAREVGKDQADRTRNVDPSPPHPLIPSSSHPLTSSSPHLPTYAQVTIADTGQGISPDFLPYVFDRFRQEDSSISRKFSGLGLGLSIVRQLVEAHGGSIAAASPGIGQGATFTVRLPLIEQRESGQTERWNTPHPLTPSSPHPLPPPFPHPSSLLLANIRVLAVDDEAATLRFIRFVLEQEGAIVQAVSSGRAALRVFSEAEFDLLVSDIGMQEMDGYRLMQELHRQPKFQARPIPAIALTAYASTRHQQEAIVVGYQLHLAKPFDSEDLIQAVGQVLSQPQSASH